MAIINFHNGNRYEGDVVRGIQHGQGTFIWASGNIYIGSFVEGSITGEGTKTYVNGDKYTGSYLDGIQNGQGVYTFAKGSVSEGFGSMVIRVQICTVLIILLLRMTI